MIERARELADFVIVDSPPLTDVIDALPLASYVDDVLIVVRLGRTDLTRLRHLAELLAENDIEPAGFAVVGAPRPTGSRYYYYSQVEDRGMTVRPPGARSGSLSAHRRLAKSTSPSGPTGRS